MHSQLPDKETRLMTSPRKALGYWLWGSALVLGFLPLALFWPAFHQPTPPQCIFVRAIAPAEQWLVVITAFGVKPAYMVLSLAWILWLWRSLATDIAALRWGLILFLGGEIACAVNYIFFGGNSAFTDYLHSYGMAAGFSFISYAMLEGVDVRLVKYSSPKDRCAALGLCRSCIKYAEVPCRLRQFFSFLIPALILIALMLPCVPVSPAAVRADVLSSTQDFPSPLWSQLFEGRYCPVLSIVLLLISWGVLLFKRDDPVRHSKIFLAAALGPLGFGLMRVFLRTAYRENLAWANIWEETTELLFVLGVGLVLWLFRHSLFRNTAEQEPQSPSN